MLIGWLVLALAGATANGAQPMSFALTSPAFAAGGEIPTRYTCEGDDISPPLAWSAPPGGTKSLALIVDDPDAPDPKAPKITWVHWVLYNLPPSADGLPEGVPARALPAGTREGLNDWKRPGYGGRVRRSAGIATFTSCTPWTPSFPTSAGRARWRSSGRCRDTSWPRPS